VETDVVEVSSVEDWRNWLAENGSDRNDVWVTIYKKASGRQMVSFPELLEDALCWGWIDTQTRSLDDLRYSIRFRKRRPGSNWTAGNRNLLCALLLAGRVEPAGLAVMPADLNCPQ
jgi:uncharacterized protein YdeI (YjbR/CyaY-like superfamily)